MIGPDQLGDPRLGLGEGGEAGQRQHLTAADLDMLPAKAGQAKGDLGLWRAAEDRIGAAVARRGVAGHGEPIVPRLEALFLVIEALGRAPPPLLVHVGPVRGVHQADDRVIDMAVEVHPLNELRPAAHHALKARRRHHGRVVLGVFAHIDEDKALSFMDRPAADLDALALHRLIGDEGGDLRTGAVRRAKAPAMIGAFDRALPRRILDQLARRKGCGAVGADVLQGVDVAGPVAPDQDRLP